MHGLTWLRRLRTTDGKDAAYSPAVEIGIEGMPVTGGKRWSMLEETHRRNPGEGHE